MTDTDPTIEVPFVQSGERRHYTTPALTRAADYDGPIASFKEADVRAILVDALDYFGLGIADVPPPPVGLPGTDEPDASGQTALLMRSAVQYIRALAADRSREQHNLWSRVCAELTVNDGPISGPRKHESSLVYFIGDGSGPIKIGIARDPESRLAGLQTAHHSRLSILATRKGGRATEARYHVRFAEHRLTGEWFKPAPAILAEIERLAQCAY